MKRITALAGLCALFALAACDTMDPMMSQEAFPAPHSEVDAPAVLAYWHFPQGWRYQAFDETMSILQARSYPAEVGNGLMTWEFGNVTSSSGTSINTIEDYEATHDLTVSGSTRIGQSFYLSVSTEGYEGIELSYATRRSGAGYDRQRICYSTNGGLTFAEETCWMVIPRTEAWGTEDDAEAPVSVNLTGQPGVKNNPDFQIRITVYFENNVPGTVGNNRWDNILITGIEAVSDDPEPPTPGPGSVEGFFSPVDVTTDVYNRVRSGRTVPLKFRVYTEDGVEVTDPEEVEMRVYQMESCEADSDVNEVTGDQNLRGTGTVRYSDDQFIANWATPRVRNPICYVVEVHSQGAMTSALFELR